MFLRDPVAGELHHKRDAVGERTMANAKARRRRVAAAAEFFGEQIGAQFGFGAHAATRGRAGFVVFLAQQNRHPRAAHIAQKIHDVLGAFFARFGRIEIRNRERRPGELAIALGFHLLQRDSHQFRRAETALIEELERCQRRIGAVIDQVARDAQRFGSCIGKTKIAGVGGKAAQQTLRDFGRDFGAQVVEQIPDHLCRRGLVGIDPVDVEIGQRRAMMIDENLEARAIYEMPRRSNARRRAVAIENEQALRLRGRSGCHGFPTGQIATRNGNAVVGNDPRFFAHRFERVFERERRTDGVAVRPDVSHDQEGFVTFDGRANFLKRRQMCAGSW